MYTLMELDNSKRYYPQRFIINLRIYFLLYLFSAIISRQFVEMTKARIEGLLAAFPKLMSSGKQHTFVETESVRYVYQPLEKVYMLLITTKASNILEDLETLRLFARVVSNYINFTTFNMLNGKNILLHVIYIIQWYLIFSDSRILQFNG